MSLQFIVVDDSSPGAVQDAGMTSDATDITSTLGWIGTTCTLSSTLDVTGNATFGGTVGVTGNVAVNTDKFTVAAASGNTVVAGTLAVTGAQTFTGATTHSAAVAFGGTENAATHGVVAIPITKGYQGYTTDATSAIAATLADGAVGQRIFIKLTAKDTNNMVITPAHLTGGTTLTFDATGEYCELMFIGSAWVMLYGTCTLA